LLKEEMRRSLEFLEWKEKWWNDQAHRRSVNDSTLAEGLESYAVRQGEIQRGLRVLFREQWDAPL
ncbi:hypothetical protein BJ165DRAFT_1331730, partial [Panaeolus papilionaceus]